jgi:MFS family permease
MLGSAMADSAPSGSTTPTARFSSPELQIIFAITLIAVLGVSTISPALPRIVTDLGITQQQVSLLITVFTLPGVILTPIFGMLADRLGRKQILVPALVVFALAGAACSLARDLHLLIGLRLLQGVGAAPLGALNVTLIGDIFKDRQRIAAMGLNASVLSVGTAVYPSIGGALAMLGWYYPFALPLMALPVALLVGLKLEVRVARRSEALGTYLGQVWRGIRSAEVLALFGASLSIFILLYGAYLTVLPLIMSHRLGATPLIIGLIMTSCSITSALTTSQLGRLARRIPERRLVRWGFVVFALALLTVPAVPNLLAMLVPAALLGLAFATTIPPVQSIIAGIAPTEQRAAFMSLNGMVLRLGQTIGPLALAAVAAAWGTVWVFVCGAGLALLTSAMLAVLVPVRRPPEPAEPHTGLGGGPET